MPTKQDWKYSFNIFSPKKYIRGRIKTAPYVLAGCFIVIAVLFIIWLVTGIDLLK